MRANPLPLIGGFYADETRPWSQQDICNWLPVASEGEGARTPTMAKTPPGLSPYARISGEPVRGVYNAEGRLFAVMGNTLYQITTTASISLGSISGVGRVRFSHNQITGGNEVLIVNGSAGWIWNTVTRTLTLITDTGYPGAIDGVFIDGYFVQIEPARRFAFNSDLADGLNYNTLDRFTSEVSPDLLVGMAVSNNELLMLSETTGEFFENTGASQQPFRSKRISFQRGCAGRYTIKQMDNTVFWLGDDGSFYLLDGYSPRRISTRPIEQAIRGLNWAQAFAFVWEDSGHSVCYWTFPDGLTFGYDASQQKWHRRSSYGFDRWRVNDTAYWQNQWMAGDFQKGRLFAMDWAYPYEYDKEFISELTSPVIHDNQSRVLMPRLEVIMDTGQEEAEIRDWVIDQPALSITGDLPNAFVNDNVSYAYAIAGGVPSYVCSILSGSLPVGTSLSSSGVVSGTYASEGSFSWVVQVVDGDGNTATVPDSAVITQVDWLIAYGSSGGTSLEISQGGIAFAGSGFAPTPNWAPNATTGGATNGTSYLVVTVSPSVGNYGLFYNGTTFAASSGLTVSASGSDTVYAGGYWNVCTGQGAGSGIARAANGINFAPVATAPGADTLCFNGTKLYSANASRNIHKSSDSAGSSWSLAVTIPFQGYSWSQFSLAANPLMIGLIIIETGAFGGSGVTDARAHIKTCADDAATWIDAPNPFPDSIDPASIVRPHIHYSAGLGLWLVSFQNRIAYGSSLSSMTLSATVFPQNIVSIGSDHRRALVSGNSGMLQWTENGSAWTPISSGIPSTNIWLAMPIGHS